MENNTPSTQIVKAETGQVVNQPQSPGTFNPAIVVKQATEAANALADVLKNKKKPVVINGETYLEYEDWQTLARFYGFTVETGSSEEVWREGKLVGYTAKSVVYQNGIRAGGAEASCMRDESKWNTRAVFAYKNGQRVKTGDELVPEFQLKSMAQTRAGSKGLRNVLAFVAVLAGYKPTPAEEMDGVVPNAPVTPVRTTAPVQSSARPAVAAVSAPEPVEAVVVPSTTRGKCPECGCTIIAGRGWHRPDCPNKPKS
jgi:hypothetical protein